MHRCVEMCQGLLFHLVHRVGCERMGFHVEVQVECYLILSWGCHDTGGKVSATCSRPVSLCLSMLRVLCKHYSHRISSVLPMLTHVATTLFKNTPEHVARHCQQFHTYLSSHGC